MNAYKRLPVVFERGEGVWLWDTEGNRYLDALSGIAVTGLGHSHPKIVKAVQDQSAKLLHTSNLYQIANQAKLADALCRLTGLDKAFFCNSGAEAVETALKISRLYGHSKGIDFPHVVVMANAFHGRSMAAIAAGGNKRFQEGFEPLTAGFIRVPFNDIEALKECAKNHNNIAAVLVEPVQGESGIRVPAEDYLVQVRKICDDHGFLMMLDEVQTGMGRTGALFDYLAYGYKPDVLMVAKALANGIPIGVCLAKEPAASLITPGSHGSTFGGNPFACAVALATVKEMEELKIWENAKKQGDALRTGLQKALKNNPHVKEVRGKGLLIGIELDKPCRDIILLGLKKRLLFTVSSETVIRLLPPLIFTEEHVNEVIKIIPEIINEFYENAKN